MPPDVVINLNEERRAPTPNRNANIPPPPRHPPGAMPPRVVNAAPHPPQRPPPPPQHHQHPLIFQHEPPIRISDIRKERITADQAREELSLYRMYRFEPSHRAGEYDDGEDLARGPNWESVFVTEVRDVSKKEAARQVRHLNETTWSVGDKKETLSGAQQRQLEKVLDELQAHDHPCYQTNLVQLHHQLRPKLRDRHDKHDRHHHHHHHKGSSKYYKEYRDLFRDHKHRKKSSPSKDKKKGRPQERVSITAYYKTSPKPELDALVMFHQREPFLRRMVLPLPPPPMVPPPEHHHGHEGGQVKGGGNGGGGGGGGGGGWNGNKGGGGGGKNGQVATVIHPNDQKRGNRHSSRSPPGSPMSTSSNSDRSFFSDTFSATDDMSHTTPDSENWSQGSRRGSFHRHRPRKERQYRVEAPVHFGIHRHHDQRGRHEHRISDEFTLPIPQLVQPAVVDIQHIRHDAYEAGRADGRADVQQLAENIALASALKPRHPPRILQQHRPSIRLVRAGDISHDEATLERLERLDMRDEALEEARFVLPAGRRGGGGGASRRDEVWEDNRPPPRGRKPLDDALEHMRRADEAAEIPFLDNPFTPMPGRGRRVSVAEGYADFGRRGEFEEDLGY